MEHQIIFDGSTFTHGTVIPRVVKPRYTCFDYSMRIMATVDFWLEAWEVGQELGGN